MLIQPHRRRVDFYLDRVDGLSMSWWPEPHGVWNPERRIDSGPQGLPATRATCPGVATGNEPFAFDSTIKSASLCHQADGVLRGFILAPSALAATGCLSNQAVARASACAPAASASRSFEKQSLAWCTEQTKSLSALVAMTSVGTISHPAPSRCLAGR